MSNAPAGLERRPSREAARASRWLRRRIGLARLRSAGDPALGRIAHAIEAGRLDRLEPPEREWVDRIERLRRQLEASSDEIHVVESEYTGDPVDDTVTVDRVGDVCRRASHPPMWARVLFGVLRRTRPETCLELGTCLGVSAAYEGAALELNGRGRLISLEGARERAALAANNLAQLELGRVEVRAGRFEETLEPALSDLGSVDFAFIDGHHDEEATLRYFRLVLERGRGRQIQVLDDIRWSDGMTRAWEAIRGDAAVRVSVDLGPVGLCVIGGGERRFDVSVPLA